MHGYLSSARNKHDVLKDIEESAATLGLARSDSSLVFCRSKLEEQVEVTKKALAYVEIIVTSTCVYLLKGTSSAVQSGDKREVRERRTRTRQRRKRLFSNDILSFFIG